MEPIVSSVSLSDPAPSIGTFLVQDFSTRDLPAQDQFDAWRDLMADLIELRPAPGATTNFLADFSSWSFGDVVFTRAFFPGTSVRHWRHRPKSHLDYWCVVLARTFSDDRPVSPLSLNPSLDSLTFRSLAMPFEGQASDTEVLTLYLPRDLSGNEMRDFERAHDMAVSPQFAALLAGYMDSLAHQLPQIPPEYAQSLAAPTRALVAACIAPCLERVEAADAPLSSIMIERARLVVRRNMASPEFGPERLRRLLAVSRSKLYRLFESSGGVAHFINRERLREAHRRLSAHPDALSIHLVGNEVGFGDHSTFSRAFRREFGYSPSEARDRAFSKLSATQDVLHA
jgi:AraC-like DNA-binding protein